MKICKDCKHCMPGDFRNESFRMNFAECVAPKNTKSIDPVTGEITRRYQFASSQRSGGRLDAYLTASCGPQARWFDQKERDAVEE